MKMTRGAIAGIVVFFGGGCDAQNNQANDEPVQTAALEDDGAGMTQTERLEAMLAARRASDDYASDEDVEQERRETAATAELERISRPDDEDDGSK